MTAHLRHIVFVFVSVIVSVSVFTSCNLEDYAFRKELGAAAKLLNTQCPMSFPYGSLERIFVERDTLCTLVKVNLSTKLQDVAVGPEERSVVTSFLLITLSEDTTQSQLADMMREMAAHNVWLRIRVDDTFFRASPALLDSVFNGRFSVKEAARVKVQMQVLMAKRRMPIVISDQMKMTAIDYEPGLVTMAYTMAEDDQVNLAREEFRTTAEIYVRQRIWKDLMSAKKQSTQDVIHNYYLAGCKVRYTCTGDKSGGHLELLFTQGDLRMLLSHYGIHP